MKGSARKTAAPGLGMGFFPPDGHFEHQPGENEGLAGRTIADGSPEILVRPAKIVFSRRCHKAGTKGADGAGGIDAAISCIDSDAGQLDACRAEIVIASVFALVGHVGVERKQLLVGAQQEGVIASFDAAGQHDESSFQRMGVFRPNGPIAPIDDEKSQAD